MHINAHLKTRLNFNARHILCQLLERGHARVKPVANAHLHARQNPNAHTHPMTNKSGHAHVNGILNANLNAHTHPTTHKRGHAHVNVLANVHADVPKLIHEFMHVPIHM